MMAVDYEDDWLTTIIVQGFLGRSVAISGRPIAQNPGEIPGGRCAELTVTAEQYDISCRLSQMQPNAILWELQDGMGITRWQT